VRSILSRNAKTGSSINVHSCKPSNLCPMFCYRFRRTKEQALAIERRCGFNPGANTGPVTWPVQVAAYKRNEAFIKQMVDGGFAMSRILQTFGGWQCHQRLTRFRPTRKIEGFQFNESCSRRVRSRISRPIDG